MSTAPDRNSTVKMNVYYDGLCHLCSREINHYRGMRGAENINFIDITNANFSAEKEGLDPLQVHKVMHVRNKSGQVLTGVEAFISIWAELPALRFLVPVARTKPIHFLLRCMYTVFARFIRPVLPKKSCESSPYCDTHTKS